MLQEMIMLALLEMKQWMGPMSAVSLNEPGRQTDNTTLVAGLSLRDKDGEVDHSARLHINLIHVLVLDKPFLSNTSQTRPHIKQV